MIGFKNRSDAGTYYAENFIEYELAPDSSVIMLQQMCSDDWLPALWEHQGYMSIKQRGVVSKATVIFHNVPKSVNFRRASDWRVLPTAKKLEAHSLPVKTKMGSTVGKRLPPNKVAPALSINRDVPRKTQIPGIRPRNLRTRRTDSRRNCGDILRMQKVREEAAKNAQNKMTYARQRSQFVRKNEVVRDRRRGSKESCSLSSPESCSLPSRSEALPPDGDSLRSDGDRTPGSSVSVSEDSCTHCNDNWKKMEKAISEKEVISKNLVDTREEILSLQKKVASLERERNDAEEKIQALVENLREIEEEMCQLQRDKAQLVHELHVTRRHLTRALEQQDAEISTISHVSSVFVSGVQDDVGFCDDFTTIPDTDSDNEGGRMAAQLAYMKSEIERLKEAEARKEQLEADLRIYEEKLIELQQRVEAEPLEKKDSSTQTVRRDSTFTRPTVEKTRIPKPLFGLHSSLPVITDAIRMDRVKVLGGSRYALDSLPRILSPKEKGADLSNLLQTKITFEREVKQMVNHSKESEKLAHLQTENAQLSEQLRVLKENYQKEVIMRKKYFNIAEDLKGKIRVFCRIRPLNGKHRSQVCTVEYPDEYTILAKTHRGKYEFNFDHVFKPQSSQEEIFQEVQNLVQSAVDGYNVCIFAYGQTGSGKTYTLVGNESHPGIGPRSFQQIFDIVQENQSELDFRVRASVFELYNEHLIDLLKCVNEDKLTIRKDANGLVYVQGSEVRLVGSEDELSQLFCEACSNRHTAATRMNPESSRSHLIISILIESTNKITGSVNKGKLSLVDLAGSERIGKSAVVAGQLKEANSINKSLSALGDVIAALTSEQPHVPYRNNKLTLLMQDSLGSNAKTLMFVTVSPSELNAEETLNSLMYASRVKQVTNSASRISECKEVARLKSIIMKLSKGERGSSQA